jgi:hypothetical protein
MNRLPDWESRLHAAIERHRLMVGAWGISDCWTCSMDAVEAITGQRVLLKLKGYKTEDGGYRLFARHGFKTVAEALASALPACGVLSAQRGDIAIVEGRNGLSCGPVTAAGIAVKTLYDDGSSALRFEPLTAAVAAFKVG